MGPCRPFSVAPCVLQSVRPSLRWSLTLTKRKVYQVSRCIPQHDNRQISFEVETSTARSGSSLQVTQSAVTNGETISADNHSIGVRQNNFGLKETSLRQYSERRLPPYYSVVGRSARVALAQDVTTNSDSCRVTDNSPRILYTLPISRTRTNYGASTFDVNNFIHRKRIYLDNDSGTISRRTSDLPIQTFALGAFIWMSTWNGATCHHSATQYLRRTKQIISVISFGRFRVAFFDSSAV